MQAIALLLVATPMLFQLQDAIVVDTRSAEEYAAGHIPGAIHLDPDDLALWRGDVQGMLRPPEKVAKMLRKRGLDPEKQIVVYSGMEQLGDLRYAARMFWILEYFNYPRVAILDGGFAKWCAEGREVEHARRRSKTKSATSLAPNGELLATTEEVVELLKNKHGLVIDARSEPYHTGQKKDPFVARAGRIPETANAPMSQFVSGPYFTFKNPEELGKVLASVGVSEDKPAVFYCNSGMSASVGYFAGRLAGLDNLAVYDGSMAEWAADPDRDVVAEAHE